MRKEHCATKGKIYIKLIAVSLAKEKKNYSKASFFPKLSHTEKIKDQDT